MHAGAPRSSIGSGGKGKGGLGGGSSSGGSGGGGSDWDSLLDLGRQKKVKSKDAALPVEAFSGGANSFAQKALSKQEERRGGQGASGR
jgi:hypothetical protein